MPDYSYRCPKCESRKDVSHGMNETPMVSCDCGYIMRKIIVGCNLIVRSNNLMQQDLKDATSKARMMKAELKRDYGIESFTPLGNNTTETVYNDVKLQGGLVKEKFAASKEKSDKARKEKLADWTRDARKRTPARWKEKKERKAAEDAKKRAIVI